MARKNRNAGASPLTSPQTREEMYLANIAGIVATKPAYPFTRTERYLDAISSGTSGLADRVTALETGKLNVIGKGINLLDNAYFIGGGTAGQFPVNQRGNTTGTVSTEGFIDRWILSGSYNLYANSLWLSQSSFFSQKIDPALGAFLNGKTVTVSLLHADGTLDTGSAVYVASPSANVDFFHGTRCYACLIGGQPNQIYFVQDGDNIGVVAAKLELGTRQTLARQVNGSWVLNDPPPDYGEELAKCQRYLWLEANVSANSYVCANGVANTTTSAIFTLFLPQNLRESGDATLIASSVAVYSNTDNSTRNCTAVRIASLLGNNVGISATISGATPGESVRLVVLQGGSFGISKEL